MGISRLGRELLLDLLDTNDRVDAKEINYASNMRIIGIETSCDETAIGIYDSESGLLAHKLHSQVEEHAQYGGVVPELASRDHVRKLIPLLESALNEANLNKKDIDGIAYTSGPGLIGALLVGASFARSLAWAWEVPSIGIHHLEAHLLAPMLEKNPPECPFIALLVSGGHSMLVQVDELGHYQLLGETLDDAAGEAFDKTAKLLGLGYPGGPAIARLAEKGRPQQYTFPRPMVNRPGMDLSFSGLKTFTLNTWEKSSKDEQTKADIAWAFQDAVADTLAIKAKRALQASLLPRLVVAGGVSANTMLRERLENMAKPLGVEVFYPRLEFCTDNGAMVAYAGCRRLLKGESDQDLGIHVKARWPLQQFSMNQ